jgi:hypothetical protein
MRYDPPLKVPTSSVVLTAPAKFCAGAPACMFTCWGACWPHCSCCFSGGYSCAAGWVGGGAYVWGAAAGGLGEVACGWPWYEVRWEKFGGGGYCCACWPG